MGVPENTLLTARKSGTLALKQNTGHLFCCLHLFCSVSFFIDFYVFFVHIFNSWKETCFECGGCNVQPWSRMSNSKKRTHVWTNILLMAEILHHLGWCQNLVNDGINYQPQLVSRISSINSSFGRQFPSTDPSLPKSSKYLLKRCLDPLKAFSGDVWGSQHLLTGYLEDKGEVLSFILCFSASSCSSCSLPRAEKRPKLPRN